MRPTCFLLLAAVSSSAAYAQQVGRGTTKPTDLEFVSQQLESGKGTTALTGVQGTPLLASNWTPGRVLTANGPVGPVWLKYNLATGQLLWRRPAGDSLEVNTSQINEFTLGDPLRGNAATFRRYLTARIEALRLRTIFFEVRYDGGRSALLRQRSKNVVRSSSSGPSLTEDRPPSWQESSQYFVKRTDNVVLPVRLNEKSLLEALGPAQVSALTAYAKREHLTLKREGDVTRLLAYYDTL